MTSDAVVIPDGVHSRIGPSSFARVEACTMSAYFAEVMPEPPATEYAAEGVVAHKVMELCLINGEDPVEYVGQTFHSAPFDFTWTVEDAEDMAPVLKHVRSLPSDYQAHEVKLRLPGTEMHGTTDVFSMESGLIHILDLKWGAGVAVDEDVIQTALYGLMAGLRECGKGWLDGEADEVIVRTTIMQPRLGSRPFKTRDWTRGEMIRTLDRVMRLIDDLDAGVERFAAGPDCRWCRAVPVCPHLRQVAQDSVMASAFSDPEAIERAQFTAADLDAAYAMRPVIKQWIAAVEKLTATYLEKGGKLSSAKRVQKRADRSWKDDDEAARLIRSLGVDDPYQPRKVLSPAMAEKAVPRPVRSKLNPLIHKVSSGLTIAPMDDPRPAYEDQVARMKAVQAQVAARTLIEQKAKPK